jgi:NADPH2:quinone reductase
MERNPMKYIAHGAGGDADCMTLAEGPAPTPGPGQILIEVACAGVNRPDVLQRSGKYPPPPDASPVLGLEVAGTVAALGDGVTDWKVGDGVTALAPGGGYAEYCVAAASHALPIPAGMDFATAAALPETWFTVWANLVDLGRLKRGERLLVHGGSSGIGLVAIQLAKHLGAECLVTVGSEEKAAFCRAAGAAHAINYRTFGLRRGSEAHHRRRRAWMWCWTWSVRPTCSATWLRCAATGGWCMWPSSKAAKARPT